MPCEKLCQEEEEKEEEKEEEEEEVGGGYRGKHEDWISPVCSSDVSTTFKGEKSRFTLYCLRHLELPGLLKIDFLSYVISGSRPYHPPFSL
jgi:hypothetical protein